MLTDCYSLYTFNRSCKQKVHISFFFLKSHHHHYVVLFIPTILMRILIIIDKILAMSIIITNTVFKTRGS